MKSIYIYIIFLLFLCCFTQNSIAQIRSGAQVRPGKQLPNKNQTEATQDTSKNKVIIVEYSDYAEGSREDGEEIRKLAGNVALRQDSVYMNCDTATIQVVANTLTAVGEVVIQQNDTLVVFSDSLAYLGNERQADLFYNVVLQNGSQKLFTNQLNYNLETKLAQYFTGAILTNGQTQLQSKRGYYYVDTNEAFFKDSVIVVDPEFELRADTLNFNTQTKIVNFLGPTRINIDDSKIYCEAGFFNTTNNTAEFRINPQFVKGEQQATADIISYDGLKKEIKLEGNAQFIENDREAKANTIRYDEANDITYLEGNGFYKDATQEIAADTIIYDSKNGQYSTKGRSIVQDSTQILMANQIDFDDLTGLGTAYGNVIWQDTTSDITIECEQLEYDQSSDYVVAYGGTPLLTILMEGDTMFMVADTLMAIRADQVETKMAMDSSTILNVDSLLQKDIIDVTLDTLLTNVDRNLTEIDTTITDNIELDSLQAETSKTDRINVDSIQTEIIAKDSLVTDSTLLEITNLDSLNIDSTAIEIMQNDTLLTDSIDLKKVQIDSLQTDSLDIDIVKTSKDTSRNLIAYGDVRIFKSDLQAVCDSLIFEGRDSIFNFYKNPLVWSDTTQFSADTIRMKMENGALDTIFLKNNSFIVNSPDEILFNQIKGRDIQGYFRANELYKLLVEGNAEFVYYLVDEQTAYIGVNKALCSNMVLNFNSNVVERINCFPNPKAELKPVQGVGQIALDGFGWRIKRRPLSKADLYKDRGKKAIDAENTNLETDSETETTKKPPTEEKQFKTKSPNQPKEKKEHTKNEKKSN